jgi:hypothetical protein
MRWELAKTVAIKAAPVVLGVLLGIGGTKAVAPSAPVASAPLQVECKCNCPKPDPIKVEFIRE